MTSVGNFGKVFKVRAGRKEEGGKGEIRKCDEERERREAFFLLAVRTTEVSGAFNVTHSEHEFRSK